LWSVFFRRGDWPERRNGMDNSGIAFIAAYLMCHKVVGEVVPSLSGTSVSDNRRPPTHAEAVTEAIALVDEVERQLVVRREMQPTYRIDPGSVKRNPRKKGKGCPKS